MNAQRRDDILKGRGGRANPSGQGKDASPRLSDLIRKAATSSEEAVTPPPVGQSNFVRKDKGEEGRLERTMLPPKEAPVEQPATWQQGESEHPHLDGFDGPDQVFHRAVDTMREILRAVRDQAPFSIWGAEEAAGLLLQELQAGDALLVPVFTARGPSLDPAAEAVNVCILAVKFGLELGYTREELRRLSLTALLHDVGMTRLPEGLERKGPLTSVEQALLGRHTREGAKIVQGLGPEYKWLSEVIYQVHERVDGSGYPQALKGTEVHEHAQVVGLADVYESLVHPRPYRDPMSPLEALKEILNRERTAFPDRIVKALIQALSPYPVGSLVRLNTGEIGRVVARNKDHHLRPVVEVLVRGGRRLEERVVTDLSKSPLLTIQDSIVEESLP